MRADFGAEQVFIDLEGLGYGEDFVAALEQHLARCKVVLALMDPKWLDARDGKGRRRIDNGSDFVRLELRAALGRPGVRVVPLLIDGAEMPVEEDLPPDLRPLLRRQAMRLHFATFSDQMDQMKKWLVGVLTAPPPGIEHLRTPGPVEERVPVTAPKNLASPSLLASERSSEQTLLPASARAPTSNNVSRILEGVYSDGFSARKVNASRIDGTAVTQTLSLAPSAEAIFEGISCKGAMLTMQTTTPAGSLVDVRTIYFSVNPFVLYGESGVNSSHHSVTFPRAAIPSLASPGQLGPLFSSSTYTDSTKSTLAAVSEATWSVEVDGTGSGAFICINLVSTDFTLPARQVTRSSICYRVDSDGRLRGLRTKIALDGEELDLR